MSNVETNLLDRETRNPAVYIKKDGIVHLFDCGRVEYPQKLISKLENIFISHAHIDHLIGFDEILGMKLYAAHKHINVFGPGGITEQIMHKINAYTWNLVEPDAISIDVYEMRDDEIRRTKFSVNGNMAGELVETGTIEDNTVFSGKDYTVKRIILNHGIPSIGYSFEESQKINISREKMEARNLSPGPWINVLKEAFIQRQETEITVGDKVFRTDELTDMLEVNPGTKIVYLTDFLLDDKTRSELSLFAGNADILYCEASYKNEELEIARRNMHLTEGQAEDIAALANVRELIKFHRSERYGEEG